MTQPTKREQLAAMRLEEFKEHLRTIAGGSSEQTIKTISRWPVTLVCKKLLSAQ